MKINRIPSFMPLINLLLLSACSQQSATEIAWFDTPRPTAEPAAAIPSQDVETPIPTTEPSPEPVLPVAIDLENVTRLALQTSIETEDEKATSTLALSRDGRFLAYAYSHDPEKAIRLWDLEEEVDLTPLMFHTLDVTALAFSPDGELLAAGSLDGSLTFWRVGTWEMTDSYFTLKDGLASLDFSPDGQLLALGGYKNKLAIWKLDSQEVQLLFNGTGPHITNHVLFTKDGSELYATTDYADVTAWSTATGELLRSFRGEACIGSFDLSSDETRLAYSSSCSSAHEPHDPLAAIAVREVGSGEAFVYGAIKEVSTVVKFTNDDALILTNSGGTIRFWNALDGSLYYQLPKSARYVEFLLSTDGSTLILGQADGDILIYGLAD